MKCRHCLNKLTHAFIDLGSSPPSNAYLTKESLKKPERWFPLKVLVCEKCWLVQTEDYSNAEELFNNEYAYFSSFSTSWLEHSHRYVDNMIRNFNLSKNSQVIEVASNDGYLLQYFNNRNIKTLGIEPTHSTAQAAKKKGVETIEKFFGTALAKQLVYDGVQADLSVANNVLAHVPDINDFLKGFSIILKDDGVATFEFPHLYQLVRHTQFDTIYHEHYSYLSLSSLINIFTFNELTIFDVEEIPTHGGSLRLYAQKSNTGKRPVASSVDLLLKKEINAGLKTLDYYCNFQSKVNDIKYNVLNFLVTCKQKNKSVVAYGAAAKGNTLLNFTGIRPDLLPAVVDKNPAKQDKYMPGSRIPIYDESIIQKVKPNYIFILPWNIKDEIMSQLEYVREWDCKFVTAFSGLHFE